MNTKEEKAVAACADYVRINKEIKRLGREIGDSLARCPGVPNQCEGETHLREFYANVNMGSKVGSYAGKFKGQEEFEACPHCFSAHKLIQDRKSARRRLGAVKRQITQIGMGAA